MKCRSGCGVQRIQRICLCTHLEEDRFESRAWVIGSCHVTIVRQTNSPQVRFQLLADPMLKVIRQYGVEHHKAIEVSTGKMNLFGVHLAMVPSVKTMAIPTTLLIDEEGIVRWIDQTDDYRLRSHNERILQVVGATFPHHRQ